MTQNQHQVFVWMLSRVNSRREVKLSTSRLATKFNFSNAYAERLLKEMVEKELLDIIHQGTGKSLYRLENIHLPSCHVPPAKRKSISLARVGATKRTYEKYPSQEVPLEKETSQLKIRSILPERGAYTNAGATRRDSVEETKPQSRLTVLSQIPKFTVRVKRTPFTSFRSKQHTPAKWNAQDIVCYYGLLFQYDYGTFPQINWKRDVGAARNLLQTFDGDPEQVKVFLQIAFGLVKRNWTIGSLSFFTHQWVINMVLEKNDLQPELAEDAVDLYRDKEVLEQVA